MVSRTLFLDGISSRDCIAKRNVIKASCAADNVMTQRGDNMGVVSGMSSIRTGGRIF